MAESGIDMTFDALMENGSAYIQDMDFDVINTNTDFYELQSRPITTSESAPTDIRDVPSIPARFALRNQLDRQRQLQQQTFYSQRTHGEHAKGIEIKKRILFEPVGPQSQSLPPQTLKVTTILQHPTRFHVEQKREEQLRLLQQQFGPGFFNPQPGTAPAGPPPVAYSAPGFGHGKQAASLPTILERAPLPTDDSTVVNQVLEGIISLETGHQAGRASSICSIDSIGSDQAGLGGRASSLSVLDQIPKSRRGRAGRRPSDLALYSTSRRGSPTPSTSSIGSQPYRGGRVRERTPDSFPSEAARENWRRGRERKDTHNKIEKNRREYINVRLKDLQDVVPLWSFENAHTVSRAENRRRTGDEPDKNKGTTLKAGLNYIHRLHEAHYHSAYDRLEMIALLEESKKMTHTMMEMQETLRNVGIQPPAVELRKYGQRVISLQGRLKKHDYLLDSNVWKCLRVEHNPPSLASDPNPVIERHSTQPPRTYSPSSASSMERSFFKHEPMSQSQNDASSICHTDSSSDFQQDSVLLAPLKQEERLELEHMSYASMDMGQEQPMFDDGDLESGITTNDPLLCSAFSHDVVPHEMIGGFDLIHDIEYGSIDVNSIFN